MKKIILSAASLAVAAVASVSVAPTTSEAVPAFARQTGAACLNCHFQSFPGINAFGRSFKMNSFTDGGQDMIEDDMLSIPASLNVTLVFRPQLVAEKTDGVKANSIAATADQVVLVGGKVGANTGAFVEIDTTGGGFANSQMFNSWDMGDLKAGVAYYNTGFGEDAGLQLMNVWGQHGGLMAGKSLSINNSMGAAGNTIGFSGWVGNEMWQAQLGFVDPAGTAASFKLAPMVRATGFFEAGDFELGAGLIAVSGTPNSSLTEAKRTGVDFQAQGEVGDAQIGVYVDYATAPKSTATKANFYNASTTDARTGFSLRATVKPTHTWVFLAGLGQDKTGTQKIAKVKVAAEYEVYQNFVIALIQDSVKTTNTGTSTKTDTTTLDIEFLM